MSLHAYKSGYLSELLKEEKIIKRTSDTELVSVSPLQCFHYKVGIHLLTPLSSQERANHR